MASAYGTKELIEQYLSSLPEETATRTKKTIERDEVYACEKRLGKPLIEMTAEEIVDMVVTYRTSATSTVNSVGYIYRAVSKFRAFFNWYAYEVKLIRNPLMRYTINDVKERINKSLNTVQSPNFVKSVIEKIRNNAGTEDQERYYELIVLLYYYGVDTQNIISLKESDIDFEKKSARIIGENGDEVVLQLPDRCIELLVDNHKKETFEIRARKNVWPRSWNGSYVKFAVYTDNQVDFDARPESNMKALVTSIVSRSIAKCIGENVTKRNIYLAGFRRFLDEQVGRERAKELLLANNDSEKKKELETFANMYGIGSNVTSLRLRMSEFTW